MRRGPRAPAHSSSPRDWCSDRRDLPDLLNQSGRSTRAFARLRGATGPPDWFNAGGDESLRKP